MDTAETNRSARRIVLEALVGRIYGGEREWIGALNAYARGDVGGPGFPRIFTSTRHLGSHVVPVHGDLRLDPSTGTVSMWDHTDGWVVL